MTTVKLDLECSFNSQSVVLSPKTNLWIGIRHVFSVYPEKSQNVVLSAPRLNGIQTYKIRGDRH